MCAKVATLSDESILRIKNAFIPYSMEIKVLESLWLLTLLALPVFVIYKVLHKEEIKNWAKDAGSICAYTGIFGFFYNLVVLNLYYDMFLFEKIYALFQASEKIDLSVRISISEAIARFEANKYHRIGIQKCMSYAINRTPVFILAIFSIVLLVTLCYIYINISKEKKSYLLFIPILFNFIVILGIAISCGNIFPNGFSLGSLFSTYSLSDCAFGNAYYYLTLFSLILASPTLRLIFSNN